MHNKAKTKSERLEELGKLLITLDVSITIKGIYSCVDRIMKDQNYGSWRSISKGEQTRVLELARAKIIWSAASGRHHRKLWCVGGETFNTRTLFHHMRTMLLETGVAKRLPTEQNFGRRLIRLQMTDSPIVSPGGEIKSVLDLLDAVAYWPKNGPASIYRMRFIDGPASGATYIGITQCTVEERMQWHLINAKRCRETKNRLYVALNASIEFNEDRNWLEVEILETHLSVTEAQAREDYFCNQALLEVGENLLNSAQPGSIGGRNGSREVLYGEQTYYFDDGVRAVARSQAVPPAEFPAFKARFRYYHSRIFSNSDSLDGTAEYCLRMNEPQTRGRKAYSRDSNMFLMDGEPMSLREIADRSNLNHGALRSLLLRRGLLYQPHTELRSVLSGKIAPLPTKTPKLNVFFGEVYVTATMRHAINGIEHSLGSRRQSWAALADVTRKPASSLRDWARRFEADPETFWKYVVDVA